MNEFNDNIIWHRETVTRQRREKLLFLWDKNPPALSGIRVLELLNQVFPDSLPSKYYVLLVIVIFIKRKRYMLMPGCTQDYPHNVRLLLVF